MMAGEVESRNSLDTPLSERDCEVFNEFYFDFLGKTEQEKVNLLKSLALLRQGQRRPFIHAIMKDRALAESLFQSPEERDLLLTFPSTLESIWNVILDYRQNYGDSQEAIDSMRNWVVERMAQIKQACDDLNRVLEPLRPIPPRCR
jgi:hypothetical protein